MTKPILPNNQHSKIIKKGKFRESQEDIYVPADWFYAVSYTPKDKYVYILEPFKDIFRGSYTLITPILLNDFIKLTHAKISFKKIYKIAPHFLIESHEDRLLLAVESNTVPPRKFKDFFLYEINTQFLLEACGHSIGDNHYHTHFDAGTLKKLNPIISAIEQQLLLENTDHLANNNKINKI